MKKRKGCVLSEKCQRGILKWGVKEKEAERERESEKREKDEERYDYRS